MTPNMYKSQIETPTESYVCVYPWAAQAAIDQQNIFWPAEELGVEEDEQDFRTKLTEGELHAVTTAQSVLTQYELMIGGEDLWGGRIGKLFPRPEIQRMCATFANVELNSHAPFYDIANKVLGKATDEFYTSWKSDPVLSERISFIDEVANSKDALEVTAALAFLEGGILFSIFGFFKGFASRGFNLIPHFIAGIDGSAKDENFHSLGSAKLYTQCKAERIEAGNHTAKDEANLKKKVFWVAETVFAHELRIIEMMFSKGDIRVVTQPELVEFLQDRINIVLNRLGYEPMFNKVSTGEISKWFYKQLSTVKFPDHFARTQLQYTRNWAKHKLTYRKAST